MSVWLAIGLIVLAISALVMAHAVANAQWWDDEDTLDDDDMENWR